MREYDDLMAALEVREQKCLLVLLYKQERAQI